MSHDTYLTAHDQIETSVQTSHSGLYMSWGAMTLTLGAAALMSGGLAGGAVAVGLGLAAAFTGYKMVSGMFENHSVRKGTNSPTPLSEYSKSPLKGLAPNLANNFDPVPEVADDVPNDKWRAQVTAQAIQDAKRNNGQGY